MVEICRRIELSKNIFTSSHAFWNDFSVESAGQVSSNELTTLFEKKMELNGWTLVEQDGEHVLHNSNNMLHGNLMHSVPNTASECNLMSMDVCQETSSRNINRIVIDRRLHGQGW